MLSTTFGIQSFLVGVSDQIARLWGWIESVPPGLFAIIGASIGVLGTYLVGRFSRRPRPLLFIDHLKIDRGQRPPGVTTSPSPETRKLMIDLRDNPFISEIIPLAGRMDEGEYVKCLERALKEIDEARTHMLPSVQSVTKELNDSATGKNLEDFCWLWAREDRSIWPLLVMAVLRKDSPLVVSDQDEIIDSNSVDRDRFGDVYVELAVQNPPPSLRTLSFPLWSQREMFAGAEDPMAPIARYVERVRAPVKKQQELQNLAQRTASAIAKKDWGYLRDLTNSLQKATMGYAAQLDGLRERVRRELKRYDRLIVQGQISNTGGSPFSVLNEATLFVQTQGHRYTEGEDDDRKQLYCEEDMQIMLKLPDDEGNYDVPVSIKPGDVHRFAAVSELRIEKLERPRVLTDIFLAGDKSSYMGVPVSLPGRSRRKRPIEYTPLRPFRDWKTNIEVHPRKQFSYALRAWLLRRLQGGVADR